MENEKFAASKTFQNLYKAMEGEALACMRYTIYASLIGKSSKELEKKILEIAHNEKEHWKVYAKLAFQEGYYDDESNIVSAIVGEVEEAEDLYPQFAKEAEEEGFTEIAEKFREIAKIEARHANEFEDILDAIINQKIEKEEKQWICLNCGHIHVSIEPPEECPVCDHPKNYFMKID